MKLGKLYIDTKAGSCDLIDPLKEIVPKSVLVEDDFPTGDAKWLGVDKTKYVVEVKKPNDLIQCIGNGRFVSQLRRMQDEFDEWWLLVIGEHKADGNGMLHHRKFFGKKKFASAWVRPFGPQGRREFEYDSFIGWMTTMEVLGGCRLWVVPDEKMAARWLWAKYKWSQKKKHKSLDTFDSSHQAPRRDRKTGVRFIGKPNEVMSFLNAVVPGMSWEKGRAMSRHFQSVEAVVDAAKNGADAFMIKGTGVGEELANRIVTQIAKKTVVKKAVEKGKGKIT